MSNESHEIIDDFELDMDIETITLDDIDLREFEEPLPQEFSSGPATMEVGSIGNIENIQINTATFGGGSEGSREQVTGAGSSSPSLGEEKPLSGSFSFQPEEITLSAPSITIQTENLTVTSSSQAPSFSREEIIPTSPPSPSFIETPLTSNVSEAPSIETLNIDELEFGGSPVSSEPQATSSILEVPTIEKEETISLLAEEEPPLKETEGDKLQPQEEISSTTKEATTETAIKKPPLIDEENEIISLSGDELDKFLYGDTIGGVEVIPQETDEEVNVPSNEQQTKEILVAPKDITPQGEKITIENTKNYVPLEENFELIVENERQTDKETIFTSEPSEVLRERNEGPERERNVPLPDLEELDKVIGEPLEAIPLEESSIVSPLSQEPSLIETEEISLEAINLEEEPSFLEESQTEPFAIEQTTPETIEIIETEPTILEAEEASIISDFSPTEEIKETEAKDFEFDFSTIPNLQPGFEDENEPIALSLDELNKIKVAEEPPLTMETVPLTEEQGEVASVGPEESIPEMEHALEIPIETEVPLSTESFESIIAEEEKIEEIKQQDLNQLIEIAEPDLETLSEENEPLSSEESSLPPLKEVETVEVSLDDLGVSENTLVSEPLVSEAYVESLLPEEINRRHIVENNLDALTGTSREELRKVMQYLDNLLADLPEEKIKEFAQSEYYDIYTKIMEKLGL